MAKKKTATREKQLQRPIESPVEEWGRILGAFVLVVLAGSGLWRVAPLEAYGAAIGIGLLSGAFPHRAKVAVSLGLAVLGTAVVAILDANILLVPASVTPQQIAGMLLLSGFVAFVTTFVRDHGVTREHIAWLVLAVVVLTLIYRGSDLIQQMGPGVNVEPPAEGYAFDPVLFQKTFYLMEDGADYYEAFGESFVQDSRFDAPTRDLAGWRSPTTYWLWSFFADRWSTIMYAFVWLSAASLVGAYYVSRGAFKDVVAAVVPATLLCPYYTFALARWWFPELEFWAAFAALASAVAIYSKRERLSIAFALLAGSMREWLLSALIAGASQRLILRKWKAALYWGMGCALVVGGYLVNASLVRRYLISVGVDPQVGTGGRVGGGGPGFILYTARFCGDAMAHPLFVPWLALAGAIAVSGLMALRGRNLYMPMMLLTPLAAFLVFGSGMGPMAQTGWNDYYGAVYLPFVFILVSGLFDPVALYKRVPHVHAKGKDASS